MIQPRKKRVDESSGMRIDVQFSTSWMRNSRTRRTIALIALIWLLALADLFFTMWAHQFTPFFELNPLARPFIQHNEMLLLALVKVFSTGISTGIFWVLRRHARAEWGLWVSVLIYFALMVRWNHYTDQILAMGNQIQAVQFDRLSPASSFA